MNLTKLLCKIGIHKYETKPIEFVRNEGNRSLCRIDKTCTRCGKTVGELMWFPLL